MTDEDIDSLLEQLNLGDATDVIIAPIGKRVWWGFFYEPIDISLKTQNMTPEKGREFFFVKSASGKFVAAVFYMGRSELHWFVSKRHRRKKILANPLKNIILPFIFAYHEQDEQKATVRLSNPSAFHSAKLAKRVGFQKIESSDGEDIYEMKRELVNKYILPQRRKNISTEVQDLKNQAHLHLRALRMILDSYQVKYADVSYRSDTHRSHQQISDLGIDMWMP